MKPDSFITDVLFYQPSLLIETFLRMYWNINKCCNLLNIIILFPMQTQFRQNVTGLHSNVVQACGALFKFELNNYNLKNSKEPVYLRYCKIVCQ